jgi:hypothetical protein
VRIVGLRFTVTAPVHTLYSARSAGLRSITSRISESCTLRYLSGKIVSSLREARSGSRLGNGLWSR